MSSINGDDQVVGESEDAELAMVATHGAEPVEGNDPQPRGQPLGRQPRLGHEPLALSPPPTSRTA